MDNEMGFEERKQNENARVNDIEYSRGGGGGGPNGFFAIKTNVYSKQCFSDPNNPGKMICKEMTNSSGFDPFNKENNFKKSQENVYTHEFAKAPEGDSQNAKEESFFKKLSGKLKGIFSEEPVIEGRDPYQEQNFTYNNYNQDFNNHHFHQSNDFPFNHPQRDPMIDQFERMFKNMQSAFIRDIFDDDEDDPFESFFGNRHRHTMHDNMPHQFNRFDSPFPHSHESFFSQYNHNPHRFDNNHNHFYNNMGEQESYHHSHHYDLDDKPIKYSDNKIYDV